MDRAIQVVDVVAQAVLLLHGKRPETPPPTLIGRLHALGRDIRLGIQAFKRGLRDDDGWTPPSPNTNGF